ncbi:uncharacterized protein LOC143747238 [Siphateles boraxobius]|uniref:uncharacterized protein LOC143747238 n=1 Tax=Siphateles boraxobius TaxID=180520 RepID=UPI004064186A
MARYTGVEALQLVLDTSDGESTFSSEEERDYSDDDRLYFEERLDPAVDIISDKNVASSLPPPATRSALSNTVRNLKENVACSLSPSSATRTRSNKNQKENVAYSLSPSTATRRTRSNGNQKENVAKRAKTNIQTSNKVYTLSWKTETDIDMVPQTLRFLPARELGPQLSSADTQTPQTLFKMLPHLMRH